MAALVPHALVREVRGLCCRGVALPSTTCAELAERCLALGLRAFTPGGVCGIVDALARQAFVHEPLLSAALERMHAGAIARTPAVALRAWLGAMALLRVPLPAEHLDACMASLTTPGRCGPAVASASLLRALLLAQVLPSAAPLRHGGGLVGRLLSSAAGTRHCNGQHAAAPSNVATRMALSDAAWLVEHAPPPWWRTPQPHHAAVLEASCFKVAEAPDVLPGTLWASMVAGCEPLAEGVPRQTLPEVSAVHSAVRQTLQGLGCRFASDGVGNKNTPLAAALVLPDLRLVLEVVGPLGELRGEPAELSWGSGPSAAALGVSVSGSSNGRGAPALLALRRAQLRGLGWRVELLREADWPQAAQGEDRSALERRRELLLRQTLAGALQSRVPRGRQRLLPGQRLLQVE